MSIRPSARTAASAFAAFALAAGAAAQARDVYIEPDYESGEWRGSDDVVAGEYTLPPLAEFDRPDIRRGYDLEQREAWLAECRARYSDDGLGGALIGGIVGGVAGNRIAGDGHRTLGTVAGAAVGAAAGAAIDRAEDSARLDACEQYLADYEAAREHGHHASFGCGTSCGAAYPVMMVAIRGNCARERYVEEWETVWVDEEVVVTREVPYMREIVETKLVPTKTVVTSRKTVKPAK